MNKQELKQLVDDLWRSADTLRANSDLKASEYLITQAEELNGQHKFELTEQGILLCR